MYILYRGIGTQRSSNLAPRGASLMGVFQLAVGSLVLLGQTALHALNALSNCRFVP